MRPPRVDIADVNMRFVRQRTRKAIYIEAIYPAAIAAYK